jgi:predicted DNA-binding protein
MKMKENISRFTIDIPVEKHKRLKILAAVDGRSMKEVLMESIDQQIKNLETKHIYISKESV